MCVCVRARAGAPARVRVCFCVCVCVCVRVCLHESGSDQGNGQGVSVSVSVSVSVYVSMSVSVSVSVSVRSQHHAADDDLSLCPVFPRTASQDVLQGKGIDQGIDSMLPCTLPRDLACSAPFTCLVSSQSIKLSALRPRPTFISAVRQP
jgi:hypothetical protein